MNARFRSFHPSRLAVALLFVASLASPLLLASQAQAADLGKVLVRFDRMTASTATTGTVCAQPTTASTEASLQVVFPTGYTVSTTLTNWAVSTTNTGWPSGATAWLGIAQATAATGQTVTFPSNELAVGTLYCFNWTNTAAVSTQSSTGNNLTGTVTTRTSVPATIDTSTYTTAVVTADQIGVSATVSQTFSLLVSNTTDALGTLSTGSVTPSPTPGVARVNTNAKNGWLVWAKSASTGPGLKSATSGGIIPSNCSGSTGTNATLAAGTAGYNTGITQTQASGTGTISVNTIFAGGSLGKGGGLCTNYQTLVTSDGPAGNADVTLTNNAAISATTPAAADYTDTITVVAAGLF